MQYLAQLLLAIPHLLVTGACIYYMSKKPGPDSGLMGIGSIISTLVGSLGSMVVNYLLLEDRLEIDNISAYYMVTGISSAVGYLLFGIGLLMLINKVVRHQPGKSSVLDI